MMPLPAAPHAPPGRTSGAHEKLAGIQLARGIAALLVVLFHAGRMTSPPQYLGYIPLGGLFNFGTAGVDFFFTLSGFIIYFVHHQDIGHAASLPRYIWRRVTRIYPTYWLVTAFIAATSLVRANGPNLDPGYVLRSLLLLPQGADPILGVGWTLVHEMMFYTVFALAVLSVRLGAGVVVAWIALVLAGTVVELRHPLLVFAASPYHLQFLMGAVTAHVVLRAQLPAPRLIVVAGALAFLAAGFSENIGWVDHKSVLARLMFGLASSIAILGIASAERCGQLRVGNAGGFFGGASYSIYLVHTLVIGITVKILAVGGIVSLLGGPVVLAVVSAAAVVAGCLLYKFFEIPLIAQLNTFGRTYVFSRPLNPAEGSSGKG
jgi:peptidoglycan/LPS O-acetylase OafA/YrhL